MKRKRKSKKEDKKKIREGVVDKRAMQELAKHENASCVELRSPMLSIHRLLLLSVWATAAIALARCDRHATRPPPCTPSFRFRTNAHDSSTFFACFKLSS